ncbi:universal stress protein [Saccharopolyspora taberi]|uniref:Universal stress protein n=1 Tax=Saccharopolyspora taberi TaxID=60895 RepID=A0ABN3VE73_9PSEU
MSDPAESEIVVGVDGSSSSKAALRWAVRQAGLTGAGVRAVAAWEFPAFYSWEGGPMPPEEFEQTARKSLDDAVDEVEHQTVGPVRISREIMHGHSAQVLLDAAEGAELLVVGSRGHGSFYGALLGSVSQRCAQHARCPVVIVREE